MVTSLCTETQDAHGEAKEKHAIANKSREELEAELEAAKSQLRAITNRLTQTQLERDNAVAELEHLGHTASIGNLSSQTSTPGI